MAQPAESQAPPPVRNAVFKTLLLLAGLCAAGLALRTIGTHGLTRSAPTPQGAAALVGLGAILAAAGMPRQAVAFAGGYVFGAWRGGALSLLAQMLACTADFWWARSIAHDWAARRLRGRMVRVRTAMIERPFIATLTLRLLPVGNNVLVSFLAGISGIRIWPFLAGSLIGYIPQSAVFVLAGSGVQVGRSIQLAIGAFLFVASAGLGWVLLRRTPEAT